MIEENQSEENVKKILSQFKEYYIKLKSTITENQLEEFWKLKNDQERIKYVSEIIPFDNWPVVEISENGKDEKRAKEMKESGNKAFGKSDYNQALKCYTDSILFSPQLEDNADLVLTLANRSAVLYHLQEYQLAINDIDTALSLNYPKILKYKVLERKAKCLLALKKHEEALKEFRNTIQALDDGKLPTEKKMKLQTDIQIMLGIMTKPMTTDKTNVQGLSTSSDTSKNEEYKAKLSSARNKTYEAACDKVEIKEDPSAGRFASAAEDICAGDTLLIEKAYCSVLLADYCTTNCQNCFKRTIAPYPCPTCTAVIFCSVECQRAATSTYHKYECKVLKTLQDSGISITVFMALRMITQKNLPYFLELRNKFTEKRETVETYKSTDYLNVYHLVRHEGIRKREDFFERSVMALFLLRCLLKVNYFSDAKTEETKLSDDEVFIGGLLLRHLQILQFNAHEISELQMTNMKILDNSKSMFIGGGLFSTLALFNHSCDPGIVRYFDGAKVIVRAVKPIKKGEMIAENYGPIYSQMKKKERQEKLQMQYWFKCSCAPCEELWPTFDEIDKKVIRFRCDARQTTGEKVSSCKNILSVPVTTEDFMIKCFMCGQFTNLLKGLKLLQDTDTLYQKATALLNKGNHQSALVIYLQILTMLHDILAPPFRDYLVCQQSIRKCMLTLGNKYVKTVENGA